MDLRGRRVFLTGAGSGIGLATALACAREGAVLFLTDLDAEAMARTAADVRALGAEVGHAAAVDVSDEPGVRALAEEVTRVAGPMDVVMNIAGIASWGTVTALPHATWRRVVDVNLMGPVHVIEHFVPPMVAAGRGGHLVNVSSTAGIIGMPWHAAYSASKFGLRGVSEVLRFDLHQHGIGVSLVCPGAVDTGLTETVHIAGVDTSTERFRRLQARFRRHAVTPERAAEAILDGVRRNRYWVYTSRDIWALHLLERWFPPAYAAAMRAANRAANRALPDVGRATRADAEAQL